MRSSLGALRGSFAVLYGSLGAFSTRLYKILCVLILLNTARVLKLWVVMVKLPHRHLFLTLSLFVAFEEVRRPLLNRFSDRLIHRWLFGGRFYLDILCVR